MAVLTEARAKVTAYCTAFDSPLGELTLTSDGTSLTGLHLHRKEGLDPTGSARRDDGPFREIRRQLRAYFEGELSEFDIPLELAGTPFQVRVWEELRRIPYGETISYAELARRIGNPGASRAVGSANGRNRIAIIVPCHRVIAADGGLGGFGGGLARKEWLLGLEASARRRSARSA